jgi:hypothetical protein
MAHITSSLTTVEHKQAHRSSSPSHAENIIGILSAFNHIVRTWLGRFVDLVDDDFVDHPAGITIAGIFFLHTVVAQNPT